MSALTFDDLKTIAAGKPALTAHPVPVYELGAGKTIYVAELSADEADERIAIPWQAHRETTGQENNVGFRSIVAAACWCSGQERDFAAKTADDIAEAAKLLGKYASAVARIYTKAAELNGLVEDEAHEKNLPAAGDGSGT